RPDPGRHDIPQPQLQSRDRNARRDPDRCCHARKPGGAATGACVTSTPATLGDRSKRSASTWLRIFGDRPVLPLLALLAVLVVAFIFLNPKTNLSDLVGSTLRAAVPLAILAGCQTLVMLTAGI